MRERAEARDPDLPLPDFGDAAATGIEVSEPDDGPLSLRLVMASPLYRGATIAMFLSGLGMSAAAPQIASFLVNELGASLTVAGLYYLTSLTSPLAGYIVGSRSDRSGQRLNLFRLCAVAGFLGWVGVALSTELWMPFVITALVLGFAGGATSQLFAAIHDELSPSRIRRTTGLSHSCGWRSPRGGSLDRSPGRSSPPRPDPA